MRHLPILAAFLAACVVPALAMVGGAAPAGDDIGRSLVMIIGARADIASSRTNVCSGAALARDLVLTAAHCVAPAATYNVFTAKNAPALAIKTIQAHPRFDAQSYALNRATADVALVKLAAALPERFVPVPLDHAAASVVVGDRFVIAGFGVTAAGSDNGIGLARAAALVATGQPGTLQMRLFDPATKGERPGLGACTGDSGGPVLRDVDGRLMVIGVVSWSTGPKLSEGCGGLTGATPLVRYRDWIVQAAGKLGSPLVPPI
jgi:secreted trypsin-like serine protease